ncbi:AarF/ABC1/UbiB kinase family protein [Prochlorococcus sp. MIT 1307]|uniref:ABC1 kinase family protein n=1 Tax=Prochlorococcus sp. MIT 1307 TaxID=3096219 RepID=UPI002A75CDC3|nr:AarF/ABC1/UbiB kinase family protein [Prochlorococcus sp. MIT 1307]
MAFWKFLDCLRRGFRALRIWKAVVSLLFFIWWDRRAWSYPLGRSFEKKQARQQIRARWLTKELVHLGSAFIKLGQLLSARPDVLPSGWVTELADLQDKVPAFSFQKAQAVIEQELGSKYKEIVDIDQEPLGAASLAQVHRAQLKNGRQVVLKIQRPGLEKLFRLDLEVMQQVAAVFQRNRNWSNGRDFVGIAKECQKVLLRELDFRLEAQYAARFRQQFLEQPDIRIPGVVWELSTQKILCLDYLPGIKINDRISLIEHGIDPSSIAKTGATSYLKQLVQFGFFHADPHPGNLAVATDGALIYYDFGMMGLISSGLRSRLGSMVTAAAGRDAARLVTELQAAGLIASGIEVGPVRRLVRIMLKEALTPPFSTNVIEKLSGDIYDLVYGKPFRIPVELIFVMRALSTFEGVGRSLDPSFNLIDIAKPYILPLMNSSNSNPNDLINELGRQVGALGSKAVALPKRLDESLEKLEQGDLQLQIRMGESDRQLRRMINTQRAMSQSILLGCLGISAALLGSSHKPILSFIPLFIGIPLSVGWLKLQFRINRDNRIDQIQDRK